MHHLFGGIYKNKTVLVTGHTGFKGSWLVYWLTQMGAKVIGYSKEVATNPNHIDLLNLDIISLIGDIRDQDKLNKTFEDFKPEIVFHLAAQPLVRYSYDNPIETYETNVIGTLKVLEACKKHHVKAIVNITSDKAYENKEFTRGYKETDRLGGYDPYSSSKGCADLLVNSYRNSFLNPKDYNKSHNTLLSSCRAGNVIGGGDWAKDRLISDTVVAASQGKKVSIRNPNATRPWQHVLEPLSGYLQVGEKLLKGKVKFGDAWNFGPSHEVSMTVEQIVKNLKNYWNDIDYEFNTNSNQPHEACLLKLDCSKACTILKWHDVWDSKKTLEKTLEWYKLFYKEQKANTNLDLHDYVKDATKKRLTWTVS